MKIKKDDTVLVITGKDKGKKGKVRFAHPKDNMLLVEGVNFIKRHTRAQKQARQAGIIEREAPLPISNVMIVCPRCNKPARIGYRRLEDGRRVRVCHSCGEVID